MFSQAIDHYVKQNKTKKPTTDIIELILVQCACVSNFTEMSETILLCQEFRNDEKHRKISN